MLPTHCFHVVVFYFNFFPLRYMRNLTSFPDVQYSTVLLVLHFVTAQPNLNLTQLQVVVLLPSGVVH